MNKIIFITSAVLFLSAISGTAGDEVGTIKEIDSGGRTIIIKVRPGINLMMGDILEVNTGGVKVKLEVIFPMQTISKCRIRGKEGISHLKKGLPVFRQGDSGDKNAAGEISGIEAFGGVEMVKLQGGKFSMGSPSGEKGRSPVEEPHIVELSPFMIGRHEITQKIYFEITGMNPSKTKGDDLPVENITWYDAVEFCNRLSEKHNLKPYYKIDKNRRYDAGDPGQPDTLRYTVSILGGNGFRLPTEAEWEYACRGGTTTAFHYGSSLDSSMANFNGDYPYNSGKGVARGKPLSVGSFTPNAFGLYDMHGNVSEWCSDYYARYPDTVKDPMVAKGAYYRIRRGGSWSDKGDYLRSAYRGQSSASASTGYTGLRVARSGIK